MTTVTNPVLPIPEDTIQGTGSYTVPANKYGFLSANTTFSAMGWISQIQGWNETYENYGSNFHSGDSWNIASGASANSAGNWIRSGDTISSLSSTSSNSQGAVTSGVTGFFSDGYQSIRLNNIDFCVSKASGGFTKTSGANSYQGVRATGRAGWSIALYPIPKNNLPFELIEGN